MPPASFCRYRIVFQFIGLSLWAFALSPNATLAQSSSNEWVWENGSNIATNFPEPSFGSAGVYGTKGVPAPGNAPGGREGGVTWKDASGNLWLFGGLGTGAIFDMFGELNDLWEYSGGEWTWVDGSNEPVQAGVYGAQQTPSASNFPGGRAGGVGWADASGNFWIFGGQGFDSRGTLGLLNDLWKYSAGVWTWMGGSKITGQAGSYGVKGIGVQKNVPGARGGSAAASDSAGKLWLFGGSGYDSTGTGGYLNDLWIFDGQQWTWLSGSNTANQQGAYGTKDVVATSNIPGARGGAVGRTDASGSFWLFGGAGLDATGTYGYLNDLWKYSGGEWAWINGSTAPNQAGSYGTQGSSSLSNVPGGRTAGVGWMDDSDSLWIFGGGGYDSTGKEGALNDLWKYSSGAWTWETGSNLIDQDGIYGTKGKAASGNVPGARTSPSSWIDGAGNFWLFAGRSYPAYLTQLNDLWEYQPLVAPPTTTTVLDSSKDPSVFGESVTFTATVTSASGVPDGSVAFAEDGSALATEELNGGVAKFSTSSLTVGTHAITAAYGGANDFSPGSGTLEQQVAYGTCQVRDDGAEDKDTHRGVVSIRFQLCDIFGKDVSAPSVVVHAIRLSNASGFVGTPFGPGNANPSGLFQFDKKVGRMGGYVFDLDIRGLAPGNYTLWIIAGADPLMHALGVRIGEARKEFDDAGFGSREDWGPR